MINTYVKPMNGQQDFTMQVSNNISKVLANLGYMQKIKYIGSKAQEAIDNVVTDLDTGEIYGSVRSNTAIVKPEHMDNLFGLFLETKKQVEDKDRMSNLSVVLNALQKILSNPAGQQMLGTLMQNQIISDAEMNLMMQMASDEQSPLTAMGLYFAMYADMATALLRVTGQRNKIQTEAPEMVREILTIISEKPDKESIEHNILITMYNHGLITRDAIEQMKLNRNTVFMNIGGANNQTLQPNAGFVGVNNNANNVVTSHTMIMNPYGYGTGAYVGVNGGATNIPVNMGANINMGQPLPVSAQLGTPVTTFNTGVVNTNVGTAIPSPSNVGDNFINQAASIMSTTNNANNFLGGNIGGTTMFNPNNANNVAQTTFDTQYMHGVLQSRGLQATQDLGVPAYVDQTGYYYLVSAPQFRNNVRPYFVGSSVGRFPITNENELKGGGLALTIVDQNGREAYVFLLPELLNQYNINGNNSYMTPSTAVNAGNVFGTFGTFGTPGGFVSTPTVNTGLTGNFATSYSFNSNAGYGSVGFNQNNNNQVNPFVAAYRAINGPQQNTNKSLITIPRFMG
jgi:hypothetical protein|nr:MAG TPA: hypothetical protein [Caudoviricetes sp.]